MATYPLKNIKIGSDTYQIQGGEFYVIEVETSNTSADAFAAFPSKTHILNNSTITVYDKDGNVQQGFDFTKLLSAPCIAHIITHGSGGNINSYAGLIGVDVIQGSTYFAISFESDWKSPSNVNTRYGIIIEVLQGSIDAIDGYALEISGGGGGGGFTPLHLMKNGSIISLPNITGSDTLEIIDSNNTSLTMNDIEGLLATDSILMIEQVSGSAFRTYTPIANIDTVNKYLYLTFNSMTDPYVMVLSNTWNTNWQVVKLARILTQ